LLTVHGLSPVCGNFRAFDWRRGHKLVLQVELDATVSRHPLTCVVPSGSCLSKFFENTRDCGSGE
jgi:hypothetical protein